MTKKLISKKLNSKNLISKKNISNKFIFWLAGCLLLGLFLPLSASAADSPVGVAYRGHIQDLGDYPRDGSWVDSPEIIGTKGQSKRIEGFEIKLTGAVPTDLQNGLELRYNVHVQNKGWLYDENDATNWPKDGEYAGTRGESLRIEAVKIVLSDADGKPVSGYSVLYRGHVQNVGDLPADESQWLADGDQLGTVGSSLRLEALLIKVVQNETDLAAYTALVAKIEKLKAGDFTAQSWTKLQTALKEHLVTADQSQTAVDAAVKAIQLAYDGLAKKTTSTVYDKAGTFGPATGTETIAGDVSVNTDGVILQNLKIDGDLTIAEAVGNGTVTLNNVTVKGDTFVRGGGKNSIHINGGEYSRIVMEKTASGAVRIVAIDVKGLPVVVSEDAAGETIILEGAFDSVTVNAPNMAVTTQGNTTTIGKMTMSEAGVGSTVTLNSGTTVSDLVLDSKVAVKGQGTVVKAEVKADGVVFDKKPGAYSVEPGVVIPPVFPTPDSGGGYTPPEPVAVSGVILNKTALTLSFNASETLVATVAPTDAANKAVSWTSSDGTIATVAADGKVIGLKEGQVTITVTTQDGKKTAACAVTVKDLQSAITGVTVPFAGESPVTAITATNQFSGTVSWQKKSGSTLTALTASEKFDGTSTYVATISLSLKGFYSPADIPVNFFTVAGATATNGAGAPVITAEFLPTDQYKITDLGVITAYSGSGGDVLVPATVNHKGVKGIGQNAFKGQTAITGITLPATVAAIGGYAFEGCSGLTTVTFDAATELKSIGDGAFANCQLLTSIAIPDKVTEIGAAAFIGCAQLHTVTVSSNSALKSIGINAFNCCAALTAINIPADLSSLGAAAFFNCSALKSVAIPGSLTAIGKHTFNGCSALEAIIIPENVTSIGDSAFSECKKLTTIAIPEKVTALGSNALKNCSGLTAVTFTGNPALKTIGNEAFYGCTKLTALEIPVAVTALGDRVFAVCADLTTITFRGPTPSLGTAAIANGTSIRHYANYSGYDGWNEFTNKSVILAKPVLADPTVTNTSAPVVNLSWNSISGATAYDVFVRETASTYGTALMSVASSSTTTTIDGLDSTKTYYFVVKARDTYGVSLMSNEVKADLNIPVTGFSMEVDNPTIKMNIMAKLSATITPANAANKKVFWSSLEPTIATVDAATGMITPVTPGTATMQGITDDGGFTKTCTVTVEPIPVDSVTLNQAAIKVWVAKTAQLTATVLLENATDKTLTWASSDELIATVDTTGKVTGIKEGGPVTITAKSADGLKSDTCTVTVTEGYDVSVTDNKVTLTKYYGDNDTVVIPDQIEVNGVMCDVVAIGDNAFAKTNDEANNHVKSITAVAIPASVTAIGASAFENCVYLTAVTFTAPSALKTIGDHAFDSCNNLQPFEIPAGVITIGDGAFNSCWAFTTVTFAPGSLLTEIGGGAFTACKMTTIEIPAGVTTIGAMAFQMCPELTAVTFAANSALTAINESTFYGCVKLNTVQIPAGVKTIGQQAFHSSNITTLEFVAGSGLTTIGLWAFNSCPLTSIKNIPAGAKIDVNNNTMGSYGAGFRAVYENAVTGGAGTYTYTGSTPTWIKEP